MPLIKFDSKNPTLVNVEDELTSIIDFVKKTWVIPPELSNDGFTLACRIAFENGLAHGENLAENDTFFNVIYDLHDARSDWLEQHHERMYLHDGWMYIIDGIINGQRKLQRKALDNWNYDNFRAKALRPIRKIDGIDNIAPSGYGKYSDKTYNELKEIYTDYDDLGYMDSNKDGVSRCDWEESIINVHLFNNSGTYPFMGLISLHNILYSDTCQSRDPITELFGAICSHGLNVAEHNSIVKSIAIINSIQLPNVLQKELPIEFDDLMKNEFLKNCLKHGCRGDFKPITDEFIAEQEAKKAAWDALSSEEKELRRQSNMKSILNRIKK